MKTLLMVPVFLAWLNMHHTTIGVIDAIEDQNVSLEVESLAGKLENFIVPIEVFPCTIREGDIVSFEHTQKGVIIKCKKPTQRQK